MAAAYDAGVNFFDNAEVYARASPRRSWARRLKKLGWRRSSYIVSTKFFWGLHDGPEREEHAQPQVPAAGDRRLARSDCSSTTSTSSSAIAPIRTRRSRRRCGRCTTSSRAGKALYWGTSEWSAAEIMAAWQIAERHHLHKPVMEQPQYNLFHRERVEDGIRARSTTTSGLGTTTWSPLASGLLTGKYNDGVPPGSRADAQGLRMARRAHRRSGEAREGATARADRRATWAARWRSCALAWCVRIRTSSHRDHRREPRRRRSTENMKALDVVPKLTAGSSGAHRRRARRIPCR